MIRAIVASLCIVTAVPALAEDRTLYCTVVGALDTRVDDDGTHRDGHFVTEPQGVTSIWVFEGNTLQIQSADPALVTSGTLQCEPNPKTENEPSGGVLCRRAGQIAKFAEVPWATTWTARLSPSGGRMQRLETFSCMDRDFAPPGEWLPSP